MRRQRETGSGFQQSRPEVLAGGGLRRAPRDRRAGRDAAMGVRGGALRVWAQQGTRAPPGQPLSVGGWATLGRGCPIHLGIVGWDGSGQPFSPLLT